MAKRRCKSKTKKGKPCRAAPLCGRDHCRAHDPLSPAETRFGTSAQAAAAGALGGAAGRRPRVLDALRDTVEAHIEEIFAPYFEALTSAVIFDKVEGVHSPTNYPDLAARQEAAERLLNRVYGRPRQAVEHTGENGDPIEVEHKGDPETVKLAHELLKRVHLEP